MLSYNVANDLYGITRLGNAQIIPDRVPYLVARLKERAGNRLSGGKMTIEHFTVHLNKQAAYRKFAVGVALGGIVGHVIQSNLDPSRPFIDTELRLTIERRWCPRVSASTWAAGRSKRRWRWPSRRRSTRRLATSARSSAGRRAYTTAGRHRPSGSPIGCLRQYGRTHFCGRLRILSCQACISPKPVSSLHTWFSNNGCAACAPVTHQDQGLRHRGQKTLQRGLETRLLNSMKFQRSKSKYLMKSRLLVPVVLLTSSHRPLPLALGQRRDVEYRSAHLPGRSTTTVRSARRPARCTQTSFHMADFNPHVARLH